MKTMPLRVSIAVLLVSLSLAFGGFLLAYGSAVQQKNLQLKALTDIRASLKHLQLLSEASLAAGDYSLIEQEIGFIGVSPEIENLSLLDPQGKIVLSSQFALKQTLAEKTLPDFDARLFNQAAANNAPEIRSAANQNIYFGYFPVRFPYRQSGNLSEGNGVLYVRYNYSQPAAAIFFNVVNDSSILLLGFTAIMLLIYFMLHRWTVAPLQALVHNISEVHGANPALPQDGEWAVLNAAFGRLTAMLDEDDRNLEIQKNLYNILSETNQSIVRIKDKLTLCSEICQIAIKHGHFVLAWIGFIDPDSKNLIEYAKAGPVQRELDNFMPLEHFRSFGGNAEKMLTVLEREEHIIDNNCTIAATGKFRQAATKTAAIRSCAAFPILHFGRLNGVFAIYAEQVNFFSADIVKVLKEMSTDLSFAMEIMQLDQLRKNAELALKEREENLSVTLHSIGDAFITTDTAGRVTRMNPIAEQLTGWILADAENRSIEEIFNIIDAHSRQPADNPVRKALATGGIVKLANHIALLSKDGNEYKIADSAAPIRDALSRIIGVVLVFHDATKQYAITAALKESEERFRHVNEATGGYIWEIDITGRYTYLSDKAGQVKGRSAEELLGNSIYTYIPEEDAQKIRDAIANAPQDNGKFNLIIRNIAPNGTTLWEEMQAIVIRDKNGNIEKIRGAGLCINERIEAEAEIKHLAYYDSLTELPNRRMLIDSLKQAMASAKRRETFGAVLYFDVDRFKNINDSMGHDAGDEILKTIALRLKDMIREEDTAARLGGDEFVILLTHLGDTWETAAAHTRAITEKIQAVLRAPYRIGGVEYLNSCSIGITLFPQPDADAETLLKQADTALYRAKDAGRDTMQFFNAEMQRTTLERLEIDKHLRSALAEERLQIFYQPQYNSTGELVGVEALLRCPSLNGGSMPATKFLAIAEESGLIVHIGRWLLKTACKQFVQWAESGIIGKNRRLCINVSPKQFWHENFVDDIDKILRATGFQASMLVIEVTEKLFIIDFSAVVEKMQHLHSLGVKVAIDDFGTGYSSLQRLKDLPLSQLKIDNSFIEQIEKEGDERLIIETIIAMGRYLALNILAEGVETKEQLQFLKAKGCHNYQGFYFSQPLSAVAFEDFLKKSRKAA